LEKLKIYTFIYNKTWK